MEKRQVMTGLAELPPGSELADALATIDLSRVPNGEIITVLQARSRQRAHEEAQFLSVVAEVGRRDPWGELDEVARLVEPARYGADETRCALAWTRRAAESEHDFAEVLVHRLPLVFAALGTGEIDRPKARVCYDHLADLPAASVEKICRALLPEAGKLTTGQLRVRLARMAIASDPDRADDQYRKAVSGRRVVGYLNPDGTAVITAEGLPPDEAASACERISDLARAAKRVGHPGKLDQIRADLFLGLLGGRYHGLTRQQIIAELLCAAGGPKAESTGPAGGADGDSSGEADTVHASTARRPPGIEIRVELAALLGHNEHPGEIPGWGPVQPHVARRVVARQRRAEWRYAITDHTGHLIRGGITRRRPSGARDASVGGVVELHIPAALLTKLTAHPEVAGGWSGVIKDIAEQYAGWPHHRRKLDDRPDQRLPKAALRRHTQIRDRTCRGPGCRRPATETEYDHTRDYHLGGLTVAANGGQVRGHDHDLKTKGGWTLSQPAPGVFTWRSPLGQIHHSRGDPIVPLLGDPELGVPGAGRAG